MRAAIVTLLVLCITVALLDGASACRRRWPSRRWHDRSYHRYDPRDYGRDPLDEGYESANDEREPTDERPHPSDEVMDPSDEDRDLPNGTDDGSDAKCERRRPPRKILGYLFRCRYRCRSPRFHRENEEDGQPCILHFWKRGVCYNGRCVKHAPDVTTKAPQTTTQEPGTATSYPPEMTTPSEPEVVTGGSRITAKDMRE